MCRCEQCKHISSPSHFMMGGPETYPALVPLVLRDNRSHFLCPSNPPNQLRNGGLSCTRGSLALINPSVRCNAYLTLLTCLTRSHDSSTTRHSTDCTARVGSSMSCHPEYDITPWVPAGHRQYTCARHGGKAMDGSPTAHTMTLKSLRHTNDSLHQGN